MTLADAFLHLFGLKPFLIVLAGVGLGVSVGVLPGITAGMLMALTLPFTYHMNSLDAITLLIAMFVGGVSGGLITATALTLILLPILYLRFAHAKPSAAPEVSHA